MFEELRPMVRLALPVVVAELGWITMGIVDTIIVGPLGPAALGAVGTGSTMFLAWMVLGMGTLFALDTFVSQSFGAGQLDACHRWLATGLQVAAGLSVLMVGAGLPLLWLLPRAGLHPAVLVLLQPYLGALLWSAPALLAYTVFRRYLQALHVVRPVMWTLLSANLINAGANWVFVYGKLGMPPLGVVGSAYATLAARLYLAVVLLAVIVWRERPGALGLGAQLRHVDGARVRALLRVGMPAATQMMLEIGVFATAGALAARITPVALAANQIVLNIVSFFFMVALGISSAAAVRVGHAAGRGDGAAMRRAGWTALALAGALASAVSVAFVLLPGPFVRLFTSDPDLERLCARLLLIYACVQPFDGWQSVATGALRGLGETRVPMVANLVGHWGIGLPLAYALCFGWGWGVTGLWTGLSIGLALIGLGLLAVWRVRSAPAMVGPSERAAAC